MNDLVLVDGAEEIYENIATLEKYLRTKKDPEYTFALNLIRRGICFVRFFSNGEYKFYPSRFIGYKSNTYAVHEGACSVDGRETNRAITKVLGVKLTKDPECDRQYEEYCLSLGLQARDKGTFGIQRKFWILR